MKKTLILHTTTEKEKENILSLFRLPLTYFSEDSTSSSAEKNTVTVEVKSKESVKMEGKITPVDDSADDTITVSLPHENEDSSEEPEIEELGSSKNIDSIDNDSFTESATADSSNDDSPSTSSPSATDSQPTSSESSSTPDVERTLDSNSIDSIPSQEPQNDTSTSTQPEPQPQDSSSSAVPNTLSSPQAPNGNNNTASNNNVTNQNSSGKNDSGATNNNPKASNAPGATGAPSNKKDSATPDNNNAQNNKKQGEAPKNGDNGVNKNNETDKKSDNESAKKEDNATKKDTEPLKKNDESGDKKDNETDKKNNSESTKKEDNVSKKSDENSTNKSDDSKETLDKARGMQKKSPTDKPTTEPKSDSILDKARDMKNKTVDGIKDKAKNMIPPKLRNAAKGINDKVGGAMEKAAPALNALKTADKLANGSNDDKAEAVGDLATKGASAALKASGAGAPIGAALDTADKVLGNTEIGKAAKKTVGYCVTCSCCSSVLLLLMPIFLFVSLFGSIWGWIFGMQANSDEIDKTDLENAITEDMLFAETRYGHTNLFMILEERLKDEHYGFQRVVYNADGSIQYDDNGYQVFESISHVPKFCEEYVDNDLRPQGQFSTAYEMLMSNYTVAMIKEPRHDSGMSAEHMPLFQNVLEEGFTTLRDQFYNSQVPEDFWSDLYDMLNTTYNPYNPITGARLENISLRDLLLETSDTTGDAYYDTYTVDAILNYTEDPNNQNLAREFRLLQESLTRIEVMTYMMAIRNFYDQKDDFLHLMSSVREYGGKPAENYNYFKDGTFFDQFLLIPDVETYMALSSTTATPAFAYDIAVASMNTLRESNAPWQEYNGKVYYFFESINTWAATYTFYNSITPEGDYSIVCTDIKSTKLEENLYKRYEIDDPDSFFNFFESATGIEISSTDSSTFFLVGDMLPQATESSFPLAARTSITHGYEQKYSQETIDKFGLIGDNGKHTGVDFSAKIGTEVLAIKDGTVGPIYRSDTGWGNYITINHPDGYTSLYAHGNGTFLVSQGQSVTAGTPIMESGNSGNSTGPHLHLQVHKTGQAANSSHVNPISYINGTL